VRELAAAGNYLAVLATTRPDGTIHASLVKAGVLDDPATGETSVGIVVAGGARKLDFLRRSGRANVSFTDGGRWVSVEGPVRLEGPDDPGADGSGRSLPVILRDIFQAAGGTHDDWDEFDRVMARDRRCAVFVRPARISTNG
jgi:PPOX class probable F420-dependent enzyme